LKGAHLRSHLPLAIIPQEEAQAQAASGQPFQLTNRAPWADKEVALPELTEEQKAYIQQQAEKKEAAATADEVEAKGPTSFFHAKEDQDYQVRTAGTALQLEPGRCLPQVWHCMDCCRAVFVAVLVLG